MEARKIDARRKEVGFDQVALDEAGKQGFANAAFEFNEEEVPEIIEEFFPESDGDGSGRSATTQSTGHGTPLREKLDRRISSSQEARQA